MLKGQCNCGAIQYRVEGECTKIVLCHCSICRRFTGSQGIPVVLVKKAQFYWMTGEQQLKIWCKPEGSWECAFCKTCGSTMPHENDGATIYIPAGSIVEGGDHLKVAHHIFVDSKATWDEIGDQGKIHPQKFVGPF